VGLRLGVGQFALGGLEHAGEIEGKKTAILDSARETKQEASEMMQTYLGDEDDPLDGFEFLTMAEAGEVGHWSIVGKLNERAGDARVGELVDWALPIQQRHFQDVPRRLAQARRRRGPERDRGLATRRKFGRTSRA